MQKFNNQNEEKRTITIVNMTLQDAQDYYKQIEKLETNVRIQKIKKLKERIKQNKKNPNFYEWILALKSSEGKVIGKLETLSMGNNVAFITINLINGNCAKMYGVEAVEQFVEVCRKNRYFSEIELDTNNTVIEEYRKVHNQVIKVSLEWIKSLIYPVKIRDSPSL